MKHNTILMRTLGLILAAIILSAVLTALVFTVSGRMAFAQQKADELSPRADYIAALTADYLQGYIGTRDYSRLVGAEHRIWDAAVYIYDAAGNLFVYPQAGGSGAPEEYVEAVLAGNDITVPGKGLYADVIIGKPAISAYGNVLGAVFLIKPIKELNTAINGLLVALISSMLIVAALMVLPAYWGSRSLAKPIRQMTEVATAMANGDFSVRAYEEGYAELAGLGSSLNYLSGALKLTIDDLTLERNRLRAVIDGLGEGIIALDRDGGIMSSNSSAKRLLGVGEGEELACAALFVSMKDELSTVLFDGKRRTVDLKNRDMILRCTMTALVDDAGCTEGAVALIQDVTEAERLELTRREYVANVSHELRTPLSSIRGLADALNDGMVKRDEDKARYYGHILRESKRLSRLIDDLLELSRLQSGAVALTKKRMNLSELISDLAERYTTAAEESGFGLQISVPEDCKRACSNPDRVEQVLVALLDNAIKHGEGEGSIEIAAASGPSGKMTVSVSNPGSLSDDDTAHLFDRFYKSDKSHSGNGTGLGLSIAFEIMSLMSERIWAESAGGRVSVHFTLDRADVSAG